jgi:multiple sugar transport system ATP-binding protein/alpha-glucoside transport system ATP-binding protein
MNFFSKADLASGANKRLPKAVDDTLQVGLRPEHLEQCTAKEAVVQGSLDLVENLGEYALVHLTTETGVEFIAKMDAAPKEKKGATLSFGIAPQLAHYFNIETGLRDA